MTKVDQLIHTKLRKPFIQSGLVLRPRLEKQILQGLHCPLTLITAPAGFGKTTLVASYIENCGMLQEPEVRIVWLSLDQDDNQVEQFLRYLIASLQEADQTIGSTALQMMALQQPPTEAVLTSLINDLDTAGIEIALVIDDYHFITNQSVHEQVSFLLDHCPKTFHLFIVTRSDPPFPLTRLRARGQIVEFRAVDLRFTSDEAGQFLNDKMGLELDSRSITVLAERTEGWIAGLQMAALAIQSNVSIRDRDDINAFIDGFSGTNRYVLDYLLEEVLSSQPKDIQYFLLNTSILERLNAPLCEAVLDTTNFEGWGIDQLRDNAPPLTRQDCQAILEYLERANLFLIPLDDQRIWYRYHHLFADLLRTYLQKSLEEAGVRQLHLKASEWYEQNNFILEAIYHASLASDFERIEHLIEQNYTAMMNRGEMSWVRFWMGKLSKELILRTPWLCLYEAGNRAWFGQLEEANYWLNESEKHIRSQAEPSATVPTSASAETTAGALLAETRTLQGYHAYLKSRVTAMQGNTRRAIALCRTARKYIPENNLGLQIDINITLGYEYFLCGDFDRAEKILLEMIQLGVNAGAINNPVAGYAILARMHTYQGKLNEANRLLQKSMQLIREASGPYLGVNGLLEIETAALLYEWNDLEAALAHIKRGLDFIPQWGKADDFALAYVTLSRIKLALGNQTGAVDAIGMAKQWIQTCGVFSEARNTVEAAQARLWLVEGNWPAIDHWMVTLDKRTDSRDSCQFEDELSSIIQGRVFIEQNRLGDAIPLLDRLEETAHSDGRTGRLIEILMLKALAFQKMGETKQAKDILAVCLRLAEQEGYLRIFLDAGKPMQILLTMILSGEAAGNLRSYILHLLQQFDAETRASSGQPTAGPDKGKWAASVIEIPDEVQAAKTALVNAEDLSDKTILVVPLSQRELEVLQHIAQGKTNQEIAAQLIVSLGTVKAHAASIYRKLDVANRTEAVALARRLGILP